MDFADFDESFLIAARGGDLAPLAKKLRDGGRLTDCERAFLADHLEGKTKRKPGRKSRLQRLDEFVAEAYADLTVHGAPKDAVQYEIAQYIGETTASVRKRVKRARRSYRLYVLRTMGVMGSRRQSAPYKEATGPALFYLPPWAVEAYKKCFPNELPR